MTKYKQKYKLVTLDYAFHRQYIIYCMILNFNHSNPSMSAKSKSAKRFVSMNLLALALMTSACMSVNPPYQTLYEARTAINAAEQKIGPCPCDALTPAQEAYSQATLYNDNGQYQQAQIAAKQALEHAQHILRQMP